MPFLTVGLLTPQSNHSVVKTQNGLTGMTGSLTLGLRAQRATRIVMIGQSHSYRYYYYYGPLSTWRDGRALSCRETIR
jgi:hypothetical protein